MDLVVPPLLVTRVLTFFFIVSVLNLALGYGIALYLGNPVAARSTAVALPTVDQEVPQSEEEIHATLNQHDDEVAYQDESVEERQPSGVEEPVKETVEAVPAVDQVSVADEVAQLETKQPEPAELETEQPTPVEEVAEIAEESTVEVEESAEESPEVETEVLAGIEAFREQLAASTDSVPAEAAAPTPVVEEAEEEEPIAASIEESPVKARDEVVSPVDATSEAASDEEAPEVENVDADVMAGIQAFRDQLSAMRVS